MSMSATEQHDFRDAMMGLWDLVKPSEAKDLKIIVASDDGRFAGIYSCDLDQHGDRFFVLKEKPRSKTWAMASNLMSHLEDLEAANLGASARQMVNEFREIFAHPSLKYEPEVDVPGTSEMNPPATSKGSKQPQASRDHLHNDSPLTAPSPPSTPHSDSPLKGQQLLDRAKELEGRRPEEVARLCGYLMFEDGQQSGDTESFYAALFEAHSG